MRNDPSYLPDRTSQLVRDAKCLVTPEAFSECISDARIDIARLVRNAIAHHGGRETSELTGKPHGIQVVDGELQVLPEHVRRLFALLANAAFRLANETLSVMQRPRA
jgi:hypothetical protein